MENEWMDRDGDMFHHIKVLKVVASESYDNFAKALQSELGSDSV
jgi:restriction endonuclease